MRNYAEASGTGIARTLPPGYARAMSTQQNTDRILTTHVGSLPRPEPLLDRMRSGERGGEMAGAVAEANPKVARATIGNGPSAKFPVTSTTVVPNYWRMRNGFSPVEPMQIGPLC